MTRIRLGAVGYLNARPLVFGLGGSTLDLGKIPPELAEGAKRFDLRFDVPSKCAALLHAHGIDVGMIPSIEYLRNPAASAFRQPQSAADEYWIVPDLAIASRGPVASVALFAKRPMQDVRSIAMDTSSKTSVALVRVLCTRHFGIDPTLEPRAPHLESMLAECDAALIIGDNALFQPPASGRQSAAAAVHSAVENLQSVITRNQQAIEKIDLGEVWTSMTGLPFVWAFWAGRRDALSKGDVSVLRLARDIGVRESEQIAQEYFMGALDGAERQRVGARYLRDNIKYHMGPDEQAGLELFHRYAVESGVVEALQPLRFFGHG
jgi:chorismate dehydratase